MNTSASEWKGTFPVKLLLCPEALPSQELLAARSWPGCVKALGVSRRECWPRFYPWVNKGQDALHWNNGAEGLVRQRGVGKCQGPTVLSWGPSWSHDNMTKLCRNQGCLLGTVRHCPSVGSPQGAERKAEQELKHPLFSVEQYKHQSEHFHIHFSHLFFKASYAELEWQILLFLQCFLPSLFQ